MAVVAALEVVPFRPYHLDLIRAQGVQPSQERTLSHVPASYAKVARPPGPALTVFEGDRVILAGGILTVDQRLGQLWAVLAANAGSHMLSLHRGVLRFIECAHVRRLEATVEKGFTPGCRWVELLGFRYEGEMPGYGEEGETHLRYGRVR